MKGRKKGRRSMRALTGKKAHPVTPIECPTRTASDSITAYGLAARGLSSLRRLWAPVDAEDEEDEGDEELPRPPPPPALLLLLNPKCWRLVKQRHQRVVPLS